MLKVVSDTLGPILIHCGGPTPKMLLQSAYNGCIEVVLREHTS
jgi:hypothetical protein